MQSEQGINSAEQGDNPAKSLGNRIYREFVREFASPTRGRPLVEISGRPHCHNSARLPNNSARRFAPGGNRAKLEPVRLSVRQAMSGSPHDALTTPRADELGLLRIANRTGFSISLLPNGAIFAMEHAAAALADHDQSGARLADRRRHGPPLSACRRRGADDRCRSSGPRRRARPASAAIASSGRERQSGLRHQVCLWLHPQSNVWFWRRR